MASNKRKKDASQWADVDGGYAFIIPYSALRHPNFLRLTPYGIKLLLDLGRQFSGFNNGYLCATWTLMEDIGWNSRSTLDKAVAECEHYRFIERTRQGGRHIANLYALSWWRIHEKKGKPLDVAPTMKPSDAWKVERPLWVKPPKKGRAAKKSVTRQAGQCDTPGVSIGKESTRQAGQCSLTDTPGVLVGHFSKPELTRQACTYTYIPGPPAFSFASAVASAASAVPQEHSAPKRQTDPGTTCTPAPGARVPNRTKRAPTSKAA